LHYKMTRITGTLREHLCTFMISRSVLLIMRNVPDEICRENQNAHCTFKNLFPENRVVYEIMWKDVVEPGRPKMTI
jgi:hypothetical protein